MLSRFNPHFLRALLYLGGALLLVLAISAGAWWLNRHRTAKAIERTVSTHAARATTNAAAQAPADSTANVLRGRRVEASHTLTVSQHDYDSLRSLYPAAGLNLPATAPRYRPGQ